MAKLTLCGPRLGHLSDISTYLPNWRLLFTSGGHIEIDISNKDEKILIFRYLKKDKNKTNKKKQKNKAIAIMSRK